MGIFVAIKSISFKIVDLGYVDWYELLASIHVFILGGGPVSERSDSLFI